MRKKIFTLLTLMLAVCSGAWATDYYTPTSDEVIILNDVYNAEATSTGYSNHEAITWGGTVSKPTTANAGDPNNGGNATSDKVTCYSIKNNGGGKDIKLFVKGVSKITLYHVYIADKYPELILTPSSGSESTLKGNKSVYYNEFEIDGKTSYTIALHGTTGTDNQDAPQVYAIKLTKYVERTIATETFSGVKVGGTVLTEDALTAGYSVSGTTITLTDVAFAKPTNVTLTNHITYTDTTSEDKNVSVTFGETPSEDYWTGTATIGANTYTVKMPYATQSVTAITINGSNISDSDLSTLNSTKSVTIDGSTLNGIGLIGVTLNVGSVTPSRANSGDNAVFTFTLNESDNYTVTVSNVKKTYTAEGSVFSGTETLNVNTYTTNGITFTQVNSSKNFQYGTGRLTMDGNTLVPVKLSTGSAVNVTFPDYKVATKVKIYGWSLNGNGKLSTMGETSELTKSVDVSSDVFYATNTDKDIYPSVYEHNLDNWESLYFNPGGSPSQPFVIMDFVLADTRSTLNSFAFEGGVTSVYSDAIASFVEPKLTATYGGNDVLNDLSAITYASNNTSVATVNESTGEVTLTGTAGTAKITATFAGDATYANAEASYTITVTVNPEGEQTLTWTLSPLNSKNAELTSSQTSTSEYLTNLTTIDVSKVGFASSPGNASGRTAKLNRLASKDDDKYVFVTFQVADGFAFIPSSILVKVANVTNVTTFDAELVSENSVTVSETGKSFASTDGSVEDWTISNSDDSKKMTGTVTLKIYAYSEANGAGSFRFGSTITISGDLVQTEVAVGTASGRNYASYVTTKILDFASAEGIKAYIATGFNGEKDAIVLKEVNVVPAGTPIIVYTTTKGASVNVPVTTAEASIEGNALVAGDGTTAWNGTAGYTYYYLASDLFHQATSGTLKSGKAYLKVANGDLPSARSFGFVFDDEATGINMVQNSRFTENGAYYNLNGQRIAQPTKGLYIVNGKKVVIK